MSYRFIALIGDSRRWNEESAPVVARALSGDGMEERTRSRHVRLFASTETPSFELPNGDIAIGHLFSRDGTSITDAALTSWPRDREKSRNVIVGSFWGDYLLLQASSDGTHDLSVMRDPGGGVACVYSISDGNGFITSDVSLAVGLGTYQPEVDWGFIEHRLRYPDLKTSRTGLSGVRELLPGRTLNIQDRMVNTHQEWSPWNFVAKDQRHAELRTAATGVRDAVASVVKSWAKTDRSILLELSGGLDSSIVAVCLRESQADVACCTLMTPVPGADERRYASQLARYLGMELDTQLLGFESLGFDAVLRPDSTTPRVGAIQQATNTALENAQMRHGVNSSFSGGGGDSVFSYLSTAAPAADAFRERGAMAGFAAVRDLADLHQCTVWKAGWLTLSKLLRRPPSPCRENAELLAPDASPRPPEGHPWFDAPADALPGDRERVYGLASTQVYRDGAPRGAKRHLRLPLLSQPVMEACLRVPCWMWNSGGRNRAVARLAFEDLLPPEVLHRRSKGTFLNFLGAWYARNKYQMREFLIDGHLQSRGLLDSDAVSRFVDADLAPRSLAFKRVLDLCVVENWVRRHSSCRSVPGPAARLPP